MASEQTTNKSLEKPVSGWWARTQLGDDMRSNLDSLDTILGRLQRHEHTLADAGKTALDDTGEALNGLAVVIDEDNNTLGVYSIEGGGNAASLVYDSGVTERLRATATQDVGAISSGDTGTFTVSVTGAATGDPVVVSPPSGINADLTVTARVTSSDTVTVVVSNPTSGEIDPSSGDYTVEVLDQSTSYTTTEDNDGTTNVYWDAGNTRYEINNETGGEVTYEVIFLRAV